MSRNKIWVIDDDRAMRWVLEKTFKEEGFDVTSFEEAQSALDRAKPRCTRCNFDRHSYAWN